jgi:phosphate transport system substrate-binding protein
MSSGPGYGRISRLAFYAAPIVLAAVAAFYSFAGSFKTLPTQSGSVQVAGSETMRPVVAACAEEFMSRNPKTDIVVNGGGSGDGIAALLHGVVDICMTSRELSALEINYAQSKKIEILAFELALDGIAIIANRANAVVALDLEQLRGIFAGRIRDWRELGNEAGEIIVLARAEGSGTAAMFDDRVMAKEPYGASTRRMRTNEAIVAEVAAQRLAIGYTGLGALKGMDDRVKIVALRSGAQATPVTPSPDTIRSKGYPLARALSFCAAGEPSGTVKAFIEFCRGESGQALVQDAGYIPVHAPHRMSSLPQSNR